MPLEISIGGVPLSLFIGEEELLEPASRRYREFAEHSEYAFPIVLMRSEASMRAPVEFSYCLDGAKLIIGAERAEFHGVRHEYALDSLIRILLTMVLLPQRGLLLHGATVVRDGRAYIFFGRSGAGRARSLRFHRKAAFLPTRFLYCAIQTAPGKLMALLSGANSEPLESTVCFLWWVCTR